MLLSTAAWRTISGPSRSARYTALRLPDDLTRPVETVTIAGKYCESGDILIRDIELPHSRGGRPACGADGGGLHAGHVRGTTTRRGCPAVLLVKDGVATADAATGNLTATRSPGTRRLVRRGAGSPSTRRVATTTSFLTCGTGQTRRTPRTARRICDRHRGRGRGWRAVGAHWPQSLRRSAFQSGRQRVREERQRASHLCCLSVAAGGSWEAATSSC